MTANLPPIQLNTFRKLEFFFVLQTQDRKFATQLEELKTENKNRAVVPTWEAEKKILWWLYIHHKHLNQPINVKMFSDQEVQRELYILPIEQKSVSLKDALENLAHREFLKKKSDGFVVTEKGLFFSELMWYSSAPKKNTDYSEALNSEKMLYSLSLKMIPRFILNLQVFSFYVFVLIGFTFLSVQIAALIGLIDEIQLIFSLFNENDSIDALGIVFLFLPVFFFGLSMVLNAGYEFYLNNIKYKKFLRLDFDG